MHEANSTTMAYIGEDTVPVTVPLKPYMYLALEVMFNGRDYQRSKFNGAITFEAWTHFPQERGNEFKVKKHFDESGKLESMYLEYNYKFWCFDEGMWDNLKSFGYTHTLDISDNPEYTGEFGYGLLISLNTKWTDCPKHGKQVIAKLHLRDECTACWEEEMLDKHQFPEMLVEECPLDGGHHSPADCPTLKERNNE